MSMEPPPMMALSSAVCWLSQLVRKDPMENVVSGSHVTHELYGGGHVAQPLVRHEGCVGGVHTPAGLGLTPQLVPTLPPSLPVSELNPPQNGCGTFWLAATRMALHGFAAAGL